jgi:branched-chain amino acid aminotransferase
MRRFVESAALARLNNPWTAGELADAVCDLLRANAYREDVYVRPWIFVEGEIAEVITPEGAPTVTVIDSWPLGAAREEGRRPLRVCTSSWRRASGNSASARIKAFANYHQARLATAEAHQGGYDVPLFLNEYGQLTEGSGACLGFVRRGRMVTPPISAGVLEGITRNTAMVLAREDLGIPVEERNADRSELAIADEAFFMGTGWGIRSIGELDGRKIGDGGIGEVNERLSTAYRQTVLRRGSRHRDWVTEVG